MLTSRLGAFATLERVAVLTADLLHNPEPTLWAGTIQPDKRKEESILCHSVGNSRRIFRRTAFIDCFDIFFTWFRNRLIDADCSGSAVAHHYSPIYRRCSPTEMSRFLSHALFHCQPLPVSASNCFNCKSISPSSEQISRRACGRCQVAVSV